MLYSSEADADALKSANKLLDLMRESPAMQQMMMATLPPGARNPEVIRQMLDNPATRTQMAQMIAKQGFKIPSHVLDRMTSAHMDDTLARASKLGLQPGQLFQKLMAYPGLLKRLQEPRVMQAFMEIASDPSCASKYAAEPDILEVVRKVQDILAAKPGSTPADISSSPTVHDATIVGEASALPGTSSASAPPAPGKVPPPPGSLAAPAPAPSSSQPPDSAPQQPAGTTPPPGPLPGALQGEAAAAAAAGGAGGNQLVQLLMSDPALAPKLANPKVMKALQEISASPWKTIKYVFDKEVMQVFSALNKMLKK
eukprot:CAMPEP_0202859068 /NCGR_PEP_ID=MMETSP1391-20130828/1349_1 /ASSEMBLY_ACC=CAM_ASM_000867 /TAXON_ID=1034604 /ORGANISM="Chlamydomonas leiostraca, Strain SAG 11-49" /LENGTH=311 /DNA_ID=CAMNT_0049538073 /DNA_START=105 /DNA_END=1040 /DNA_ORIENTATION=+